MSTPPEPSHPNPYLQGTSVSFPPPAAVSPPTLPTTAPQAPSTPPLSPEQLNEITNAKLRSKKLQRAIKVATTDAWISAIFAAVAILSGCMGIDNLVIGLALAAIAYNSFRGAAGLKRFDRSAPSRLAMNQLMLAACLTVYFAYELWAISRGGSAIVSMVAGNSDYGSMGLGDMGKDFDNIRQTVIVVVKATYLTLILGTLVAQGLTALYYKSRKQVLDDYLDKTPPWVIQLQAASAS